jgi:hypothetical protein
MAQRAEIRDGASYNPPHRRLERSRLEMGRGSTAEHAVADSLTNVPASWRLWA